MTELNLTEQEALERLNRVVAAIGGPDEDAMRQTGERLDRLTKPPGSLGRLEAMAVRLSGILGIPSPEPPKKAVVVMAGDHGVCEEGVSAYPQEVTVQMVANFLNGGAAINVLARRAGADVFCVDVGVKGDLAGPALEQDAAPEAAARLLSRKVRPGTGNMARGEAMTRAEALRAILVGAELAERLAADGYRLLATGEMGIGNTTPSAAVAAVLTGAEIDAVVGRGTGIDDAGLTRKREAVARAIRVNRPDRENPVDVIGKVGGLEIAGLAGLILGAAKSRSAVIVDGFISSVAALAAVRMAPGAAAYLFPSHLSAEPGHRLVMEALGMDPVLRLDMRLGEGTGAALCMPLLDAALAIVRDMATFESAGVSRG